VPAGWDPAGLARGAGRRPVGGRPLRLPRFAEVRKCGDLTGRRAKSRTRGARARAGSVRSGPATRRGPPPRRARPPRRQGDLTGREASGPQIGLALGARLVAQDGRLVDHPGGGVERLAVLEPRTAKYGWNAGQRRAPPWRRHPAIPATTAASPPPRSPNPPWHRQTAASNGSSAAPASVREVAHVEHHEPGVEPLPPPGGLAGELDEALGPVDAGDPEAPPGQGEACRPGPHPRRAPSLRREAERLHEEAHLLLGPLGERVPQVRRTQELRDPSNQPSVGAAAARAAAGRAGWSGPPVTWLRPSWGRSRCRPRGGPSARPRPP